MNQKEQNMKSNGELTDQQAKQTPEVKTVDKNTSLQNQELLNRITELEFSNEKLRVANSELQESLDMYMSHFESAPAGCFTLSEGGEIVEVNPHGAAMLGMEREQVVNTSMGGYIVDIMVPVFEHFTRELCATHEVQNCELLFKGDNGQDLNVLLTGIVLKDRNLCQITAFDITKSKKAEEAQWESMNKYKLLIDMFPVGISITDKDGNIIETNKMAESLLGLKKEEHEGRNIKGEEWNIVTTDGEPFNEDEFPGVRALRENRIVENEELGVVKPNNEISWLNVTASPIPIENYGVAITYSDFSKRKRAEDELKASEKRYRITLGSISDAFFSLDNHLRITFFNEKAEEILKRKSRDVMGKQMFTDVFEELKGSVFEERYKYSLRTQKSTIFETFTGRGPSLNWLEVRVFPGEEGISVFMTITTHRKKVERELIIAKERAEESDRLKSAFLANMSHEIRTPMNGMLGFAGILKEPNLPQEKLQECIRVINKSGARLLNIVNNIIDISKIEANLMELKMSDVDIYAYCEDIYTFFSRECKEKGLDLIFNKKAGKDNIIIHTDREKLLGILTNLTKNAIKYCRAGSIELGYEIKENGNRRVEFFIKDTGIGIPKDRQEAIFERFVQADISDVQAYQGAGLGLSISKAYVEMLGGQIWVESEPGIGSTFYFTLPYDQPILGANSFLPEMNESDVQTPVHALKALIVEDDEISDQLISITIEPLTREILHAQSGQQAIDICLQNQDIDLIMMDIKMPGVDGYEATSKIREFNKEVIIIAQTAYGLSGDREKAIVAGCNDYISKPFSPNMLSNSIKRLFNITLV